MIGMSKEFEFILKSLVRLHFLSIFVFIIASLLKYFSRYGEVIDCVVMKNSTTGKSRGFGFVTFKDPSCVEMVLTSGPHELDGRQVNELVS